MSFYFASLERLPRKDLVAWQNHRLRDLGSAIEASRFYVRKLAAAGLDSRAIGRIGDLPRLPLTRKSELSDAQIADPPFGGIETRPRHCFRHLHRTSGTTGRPLLWLDTEADWRVWRRGWGMVFRGAGVGADDVVFCAFSFGPYIAHWTAMAGADAVGALAVSGGGMRSRERLRTMLEVEATVLVSTPTYALRLAEVAEASGIDLVGSSIRRTIQAGEPGASLPFVRDRIESLWGADCYDHAGSTEVGPWSFPCREKALHLNELDFAFEVIDPRTAEPVDDGTAGELTITGLSRLGMPVLRYRTGDLVVRDARPCPCGRRLARLVGGVVGRVDDMIIVRGVNLYPGAVDNLVRAFEAVIEYRLTVDRTTTPAGLELEVESVAGTDTATLVDDLTARFRADLDLNVAVAAVAPGALPRFEAKARRIRIRSGDDPVQADGR